ncbi:MAG: hypothetical protein Q9163_000531 [Psora crenata]
MSASYSKTNFDDHVPSQYNNYRHPSSHTSSYISTSSTQSPTTASINNAGDNNAHSELNIPINTQLSRTPVQTGSEANRVTTEWTDDLCANAQESPEGQLVPGPPGIAKRAKAHVPSACVNCKKKHLACETKRPCNRCIQNGKESSCVDVQHKKRGRPRLRDEEPFSEAYTPTVTRHSHRDSKTYRELRSQAEPPYVDQRPQTSDPAFSQQGQYTDASLGYATSAHAISFRADHIPTVLLTPDFVVAQHNRAFSDALCLQITPRGQTLLDLVVPAEREKIRRLQALMRAEFQIAVRSAQKLGDLNMLNTMPAIGQLDILHATAGFQTRSEYWTFRLPGEQSRGFPISISLAKDREHFIVLTLIYSANSLQGISSPPLLQQSSMLASGSISSIPSPHLIYQDQQAKLHHYQRPHHNSPSDTTFTASIGTDVFNAILYPSYQLFLI